MKQVIRLTEQDIQNMVMQVLNESTDESMLTNLAKKGLQYGKKALSKGKKLATDMGFNRSANKELENQINDIRYFKGYHHGIGDTEKEALNDYWLGKTTSELAKRTANRRFALGGAGAVAGAYTLGKKSGNNNQEQYANYAPYDGYGQYMYESVDRVIKNYLK